jgi:hypothetical protein
MRTVEEGDPCTIGIAEFFAMMCTPIVSIMKDHFARHINIMMPTQKKKKVYFPSVLIQFCEIPVRGLDTKFDISFN